MHGAVFSIEMLPAREGDCLWLEYGDPARPHVILCDGGRKSAYQALRPRLRAMAKAGRSLDLIILTHIDADHIEGILELFEEDEFAIDVKDVWFNGYQHLKLAERYLSDENTLGAKQGEILTHALIRGRYAWNAAFAGKPVARCDSIPSIELDGGMRLTILSPDYGALAGLVQTWESECAKAGIEPGFGFGIAKTNAGNEKGDELLSARPTSVDAASEERFQRDTSQANRSSLAVLAEYEGRRMLLAGDAHADVIMDGLRKLAKEDGARLCLDAFKISHHGSKGTSPRELFEMIDAKALLVSTDYSRHRHPDRQTLARWAFAGCKGSTLCFNYRQPEAEFWNAPALRKRFGFDVVVPAPDCDGHLRIAVL